MERIILFSNVLKQNSFITNFVVFSSRILMNVFVNKLFSNSLLRYYSWYNIIRIHLSVKHISHGFPLFHKLSLLIIYCVKYAEIRAFLVHIFPYMDRIVSVFFRIWTSGSPILSKYGKIRFSPYTRNKDHRKSLLSHILRSDQLQYNLMTTVLG